jgi:hypothetical protein
MKRTSREPADSRRGLQGRSAGAARSSTRGGGRPLLEGIPPALIALLQRPENLDQRPLGTFPFGQRNAADEPLAGRCVREGTRRHPPCVIPRTALSSRHRVSCVSEPGTLCTGRNRNSGPESAPPNVTWAGRGGAACQHGMPRPSMGRCDANSRENSVTSSGTPSDVKRLRSAALRHEAGRDGGPQVPTGLDIGLLGLPGDESVFGGAGRLLAEGRASWCLPRTGRSRRQHGQAWSVTTAG